MEDHTNYLTFYTISIDLLCSSKNFPVIYNTKCSSTGGRILRKCQSECVKGRISLFETIDKGYLPI
jgi:hypothetical protein